MKHRELILGNGRFSDCVRQLEGRVSRIESEKLIERIRTLENKINEVDKIPGIEDSIRQIKGRLWTVKDVMYSSEVCDFLGISESYLYRLTSSKQIPHYKPNGKMVFFNRKELCEWAMRNPVQVNQSTQPSREMQP